MNTNIDYKYKYMKYKIKFLDLQNQIGGAIIITNPGESIIIKDFLEKKYKKITINKDTIIIPELKINITFKKNSDNSYTFTFPPKCFFVKYDGNNGNTITVNSEHFSNFELHLKSILKNNYIKKEEEIYKYEPLSNELGKIYKHHSS